METTFSFGYWVQRRRKALNLTQSALAQQVGCASITIKKIERDERRPSRVMAERLAASLMVAPAERESFIRGALGEAPVDALSISLTPLAAAPLALQPDEPEQRQRFVGRERELAWLGTQLELALQGQGRMAVIAGEAGRGKTALMAEFVRRVARAKPALLVVSGTCNAYAGTGEPYLPFREAFGTLTGDLEARWTPAARSGENMRRLWQALPTTLQILVEHGPQLIDVFVPAKGLLARAQTVSPGGTAWLSQLHSEVAQRQANAGRLDQNALFEQFTRVLHHLAGNYPILISLDDLHWADEASLSLVFHLVRRLPGSRLLIVGAYRPEELALNSDPNRHPLEGILAEIKRTFGEVSIDLAASDQSGGRDFVSAFIDTEPNRLDEAFRQALFQQTAGHPLFTVELLHEMQARGDLWQDSGGHWCAGHTLDWNTLPARVEAVIARRLDHLPPALRDRLTVASVEGELFTAEVVARVLGVDERQLLHSLSQQLARGHRLVRASGEVKVGDRYLSLYQFGHALFQQYLYQQLDAGERRRFHAEVASALEALYGDQTDDIAVQLARHFEAAHQLHPAVEYLRRAGEKAMRLSAVREAITLLQQGLALLDTLPPAPERDRQTLQLQLALGKAQRKAGQMAEAMHTFEAAAALAGQTGTPEAQVQAALGYEESRWRFNLPAATSVRLLQQALAQLDHSHTVLRARLHVGLAQALVPVSSPEEIAALSQQALGLARRANDPRALYDALYLVIRLDRRPDQSAARLEALQELEHLSHTAGDREAVVEVAGFRMLEHLELGAIEASREDFNFWRPGSEGLQQPFFDYAVRLAQTGLAVLAGRFAEAEQMAAQALRIGQQLQVEHVDGVFGIQMFTVRREQGRMAELAPFVKHFIEQQAEQAVWVPGLALIYCELGLRAEAQQAFEVLAADDFASLPRDGLWVTCLLYLSETCAFLGDAQRAATLYARLKPYAGRNIVVGFLSLCYGSASHYLGLLAATRSRWAEAEQHFQEALAMNARLEAWPWLAHTQHQYAAMLLARGHPADRDQARWLLDEALETARRLGMPVLAAQIAACQAM